MLKAVILMGGPLKGTRFRPLSFDLPKPLFPVSGVPMVQHLIEALSKVPDLKEILMIGFQVADETFNNFIVSMNKEYNISVRYLQEYAPLGTAGGIHHFRDQIRSGDPEAFFLMNGDVCGDFPLVDMMNFHRELGDKSLITVMGTEATRQQAINFGCIVESKDTHEIMHYVEKPSTFVSTVINCGVYICSLDIFHHTAAVFKQKQQENCNGDEYYIDHNFKNCIRLEQDLLMPLAGCGKLYVYQTTAWWSQIKTAGSVIYANRHYLELSRKTHPDRLAENGAGKPQIIGDVFIHPSASVSSQATIGPNVSIGPGVTIGPGVRIKESIVLGNAVIQSHSLILYSIIGWNSTVGSWTRVEGTPCDPNPNKPFAKMENMALFNSNGRLNPSITVLGCNVQVPSEVIVLNSIVLPHKDLGQSYKNEIIL